MRAVIMGSVAVQQARGFVGLVWGESILGVFRIIGQVPAARSTSLPFPVSGRTRGVPSIGRRHISAVMMSRDPACCGLDGRKETVEEGKKKKKKKKERERQPHLINTGRADNELMK